MSLYFNLITDLPGQVGFNPRRPKLITSASLATLTTPGFLNAENLEGQSILPTDVLDVIYNYNVNTNTGSYASFTPTFSSGIITLVTVVSPGDVLLPVVSGDFSIFNGTTGQIKDGGYSPTDPSKTKVVMLNAAPTSGHVAAFTNINGTIGDGGVLGTAAAKAASDNSLSTLASTAGSGFTSGHLVTASDVAGTITDSGVVAANVIVNSSAGGQTVATNTSSATPGTLRSLVGSINESVATMTSGNIVGVRGSVTAVSGSGGFWYGCQGKIISTGTLSGSLWAAGIFGQVDVSAATINAGQVAALWGDWGATGATATDMTGTSGIKFTNTTANVLNEQINTYGDATFYLNIRGNPGPLAYYLAAGTSAGSAGDAAHCAAQQVLKIVVQGATVYIPVFTQNT